ncbi:MAG: zinc ABC transporter substrate-binding protein [Calditrichaeota bacterium]|nr:MAG: zinc ABC transporter substrate-binding protein [Calditrichota bacterium]
MKIKIFISTLLCFSFFLISNVIFHLNYSYAAKKIKIVTSIPDLADIAKKIGGDRVEVFAIAAGYQDPHFVDAKPSYIIKLQRADVFIQVGLDLEIGWVPSLLEGSRNKKILWGGPGYVDASRGIELLQVPTTDPAKLRAEGDIHIYGNPHYWLDPLNGKIIAENIFQGLTRISPENETYFRQNLEAFEKKIDEKLQGWLEQMRPYSGTQIYAYHNSWPYFERRFGFKIAGYIEPKPGIPPSPKYLVKVIRDMKKRGIKIIIKEPYYPPKSSQLVAKNTGAIVVELAPMVGGMPGADDYFSLFDYNINKLIEAFKKAGIEPKHTSN